MPVYPYNYYNTQTKINEIGIDIVNTPLPITGNIQTTVSQVSVTGDVNTIITNTPLPITGNIQTTVSQVSITGNVNTVLVGSSITQNVAVVNTPIVSVNNFPSIQDVDIVGSSITQNVTVVNAPNVNAVQSGTWTVGVNNFPATQAITGSVAVNNFPATQNVNIAGSYITQNVAVVNTPLPITGAVNVNVVGDQVTANVSVVNFPSNQAVTVSNTPLPITGSVSASVSNFPSTQNVGIVSSSITQNVNVVNFPSNQAVTVSNTPLPITGNVNIVGPLDSTGNVLVDVNASQLTGTVDVSIIGSQLTGTVDVSIIGSNITQNVNTVGVGYNQINIYSSAFITSNSQTIINTAQYQEMVVDNVFGGVITGAIWVGIYGVEPQSNILTSLLASTNTATLNTLTVQRLQIVGPLGAKVAVAVNVASGSEITGVYVTVEQSVSR